MNKIETIYFKITTKAMKMAKTEPYNFLGCKTIEDIFLALGSEEWGNVLQEVGYSPRYYITEVENMSKRFLKLVNSVIAVANDFDYKYDQDFANTFMELVEEYKNKRYEEII